MMNRAVLNETLENNERSVSGDIRKEKRRELSFKAVTWNEDSVEGGTNTNHNKQTTLVGRNEIIQKFQRSVCWRHPQRQPLKGRHCA